MSKEVSIIDLRDEEDERDDLKSLRPTTMNQLVLWCKKRLIEKHVVKEIYLGDGGLNANDSVGLASNIAKHFGAVVHFECRNSPGTCFPSLREAALDNYNYRRAAGERLNRDDEE